MRGKKTGDSIPIRLSLIGILSPVFLKLLSGGLNIQISDTRGGAKSGAARYGYRLQRELIGATPNQDCRAQPPAECGRGTTTDIFAGQGVFARISTYRGQHGKGHVLCFFPLEVDPEPHPSFTLITFDITFGIGEFAHDVRGGMDNEVDS